MLDKLKDLDLRYEDLESQLGDPRVYGDAEKLRQVNRELKELLPVVETYRAYQAADSRRREAEELVERWSDTVLRIAWTWTGSVHDAQDICQTVLLKLLTSPRRFAEERLERAWVVRVAVNCCKDWKKSAWVRRRLPLEAAAHAAVHLPEPGESPVLAAVQALPERYRQAVYLRYYEGYEPAEIGTLMGCTASQVSTYLYRGKAKLRNMLGGAYGQECLSE